MTINQFAGNRFAGSAARSRQRASDNGLRHYLRLWNRSLLRDVVVAVTLLAAVGAVLSVGPFALELIGFH